MDKLDETLKGLEYCIGMTIDRCAECPGEHCHIFTALELLKAQKPRLITKEDFENSDGWGNLPAWYEHDPSLGVKTIDGWGIIKLQNLNDKTTRYWTARPTEEQRKEAKWG